MRIFVKYKPVSLRSPCIESSLLKPSVSVDIAEINQIMSLLKNCKLA